MSDQAGSAAAPWLPERTKTLLIVALFAFNLLFLAFLVMVRNNAGTTDMTIRMLTEDVRKERLAQAVHQHFVWYFLLKNEIRGAMERHTDRVTIEALARNAAAELEALLARAAGDTPGGDFSADDIRRELRLMESLAADLAGLPAPK
ncbi:MAG: hypothetical protein ABIF71_07040 [Planctomycetota bacterium]